MLRRGTTLVESLVALIFLGVTAGSALSALSYCENQETYARHRDAVMEILRTKIDVVRTSATGGTITTGTTNTTSTVKGVSGTVAISVVISTITGYSNLRQVAASASWTEYYRGGTRTATMSFTTWVKPNET